MAEIHPVVDKKPNEGSRALALKPRPAVQNSTELTALEQQILEELAPCGVLQRSVAENIARNEIEIRSMSARKTLLFWEEAARSMGQLLFAQMEMHAAQTLARDWAGGNPEAQARIAKLEIDPEQALNRAFISTLPFVSMIEGQIDRLERRRRHLHEDLTRLQALTLPAADIEDAEIVSHAS